MTRARMQHCDWCGAEVGVGVKFPGDFDHCGQKECEREVRAMMREAAEAERDHAGLNGCGCR